MKKRKKSRPKIIVFDLDGVICTQVYDGNYENARPVEEAVELIGDLHKQGHTIVIHTARFMGRHKGDAKKAHKDGYLFTKKQLDSWGVKYHKLILGKPSSDILVDDRALFFVPDWTLIRKHIKTRLK